MAKFHFNCAKCSQTYVRGEEKWCKPFVDAYNRGEHWSFIWDWHDGSGKTAEAWCEHYTTEPMQIEMYPGERRRNDS